MLWICQCFQLTTEFLHVFSGSKGEVDRWLKLQSLEKVTEEEKQEQIVAETQIPFVEGEIPLPQWQVAAQKLKPSEPHKEGLGVPSSELNLEWIYGYSTKVRGPEKLAFWGGKEIWAYDGIDIS